MVQFFIIIVNGARRESGSQRGFICLTNTAWLWICPVSIWMEAIQRHCEVAKKSDTKDARNVRPLCLVPDRLEIPLAMSLPKSGEHHDVHDIENVIKGVVEDLEKSNIRIDGLFLNADAGFDCDILRNIFQKKEIIANICINRRGEDTDGILVDDELYAERYSIERTNAWMDSFRTILN